MVRECSCKLKQKALVTLRTLWHALEEVKFASMKLSHFDVELVEVLGECLPYMCIFNRRWQSHS